MSSANGCGTDPFSSFCILNVTLKTCQTILLSLYITTTHTQTHTQHKHTHTDTRHTHTHTHPHTHTHTPTHTPTHTHTHTHITAVSLPTTGPLPAQGWVIRVFINNDHLCFSLHVHCLIQAKSNSPNSDF